MTMRHATKADLEAVTERLMAPYLSGVCDDMTAMKAEIAKLRTLNHAQAQAILTLKHDQQILLSRVQSHMSRTCKALAQAVDK